MSIEKPTPQELEDEVRRLQEGVGEARKRLADLTQYLGSVTRDLGLPRPAEEDSDDASESQSK